MDEKGSSMVRTNAFTILSMLIRAISLWIAAGFLVGAPAMLVSIRNTQFLNAGSDMYTLVAVTCAVALLLVLLWLFADKIARLALVRPNEQVFESNLEPRVWLGLAISVIGAWYLFGGLKDLAYFLPRWLIYSREPGPIPTQTLQEIVPEVFALVFQLVLAGVFLLRGQGLARWFHRMRYGDLGAAAS